MAGGHKSEPWRRAATLCSANKIVFNCNECAYFKTTQCCYAGGITDIDVLVVNMKIYAFM